MTSTEQSFMEYMQELGLQPAVAPIADGISRRIRDEQDKAGKKDLWYVLHDDGFPVGWFNHWEILPDVQKWKPKHKTKLTAKERKQLASINEQRQAKQEKELLELRAECRKKAAWMLKKAHEAGNEHEYLMKKGVKSHGIRQLWNLLLVPMLKGDLLSGLQVIQPDGTKRFLKGSEKSGACFLIEGEGDTIYLVEGYATGATIHESTGGSVIVAFDCNNLVSVAKAIKTELPEHKLVICADNDRHTPGNPGVTKARAAAQLTGAKLAIPTFPGDEGTDFNDLATIYGKGGAPC